MKSDTQAVAPRPAECEVAVTEYIEVRPARIALIPWRLDIKQIIDDQPDARLSTHQFVTRCQVINYP